MTDVSLQEEAGSVRQRVVLTIPLKPEYVALCRLALTALGAQAGLDDETLADLKLAVTEACSNFMGRSPTLGPNGQVDSSVRVEYGLTPDRWVITVQGPGTDVPAREEQMDENLLRAEHRHHSHQSAGRRVGTGAGGRDLDAPPGQAALSDSA